MSETTPGTGPAHPVPIAPAPASRASMESPAEHMSYACVTCTKRKVKCDKLLPVCSTCRKGKLTCEYNEGPAPRKRKRKPAAGPEADVYERLERAEALLRENNLLPENEGPSRSSGQPSTSGSLTAPFFTSKSFLDPPLPGKLVEERGKTRYIDSNLWSNLGEHNFHPSSDEEDEDPQESHNSATLQPTPAADPFSAAFLAFGSSATNLLSWHPTYEAAMELWRVYVEQIDPLVKLIHVPTAVATLRRGAANPSTVSKATEALLFAIYHFSVTVMDPEDCQKRLGMPKSKLTATYYDALRQALVNANFLRTTDLMVLQAYLLFLLSVRNTCDPHTFWICTGIAVRLGQRMGLHRDGEDLGVKPFDVQMRRRVFWQILPLDGLAGQLCGTGMSVVPDSFSTKQPTNINDSDMWPDMTEPPQARIGATELIFCLARTEFGRFLQRRNNPPIPFLSGNSERVEDEQMAEWERQLDQLETEMETKYLRFCDFADPLHNLVGLMARTAANSGRLRIRLSQAKKTPNLPEEDRKDLWILAEKIIDYDIAAQQNYNLKRFFWHLQAFFQWDALIWILNEIWRDPAGHQDEDIWDKIEKVFVNHPHMTTQRRALHMALAELTLRAWDAYRTSQLSLDKSLQMEPGFIQALRSFASKPGSSRASSVIVPQQSYNPFETGQDSLSDMGTFNMIDGAWFVNDMAPGVSGTTVDPNQNAADWWGFWEQLLNRDPAAVPVS